MGDSAVSVPYDKLPRQHRLTILITKEREAHDWH